MEIKRDARAEKDQVRTLDLLFACHAVFQTKQHSVLRSTVVPVTLRLGGLYY